jgi:hypothetical protein
MKEQATSGEKPRDAVGVGGASPDPASSSDEYEYAKRLAYAVQLLERCQRGLLGDPTNKLVRDFVDMMHEDGWIQ